MRANNQEAYETVSWILDNADMGFFIVTAPHNMQRELAELYKTSKVEVFDYAIKPSSYSYSELSAWVESCPEADFFFVLNMQLALEDEKDMLAFNLSRDMLSKKHKAWFFFMTKDMDNRLSTFAFDIYSYVRLKAHFLPEKDEALENQRIIEFDNPINFSRAKEALGRYKDLEEQLLSLPLNNTPDNQLISTAMSLSRIAELYNNCAEYADALRLLEVVKEIRERIKGIWHPDTATTYNSIAGVCDSQGDYSKALEWYQKALDIHEKVLGKEHPDTADTYNNIAAVYSSQGDYSKALEWYIKSYKIVFYKFGSEHPSTDTVRENMEAAFQRTDLCEPFDQWLKQNSLLNFGF